MERHLPKTAGIFKKRDLLCSDAYWKLKGTEILILEVFMMKCRIVGHKESKKTGEAIGTIKNNGQLAFTYNEAKSYGITGSTFKRGRDRLVKLGFLDITVQGRQRCSSRYALSGRWKNYGKETFESKERKKRQNYKPGKGTRF